MSLPSADLQFLQERSIPHAVSVEAGMICVLLPGFALPQGCNTTQSDLLLRLAPGFPDIQPDMWWFDPTVKKVTGADFLNTEARESHLGRNWQRWSRHLQPGQWKSGIDRLENYVALIRSEIARCAQVVA